MKQNIRLEQEHINIIVQVLHQQQDIYKNLLIKYNIKKDENKINDCNKFNENVDKLTLLINTIDKIIEILSFYIDKE